MENQQQMTAVTVTLNAKIDPARRADLEDAFDEAMEKLGKEGQIQISGGGTQLGENGEVAECDIELALSDASDENISLIIQMFSAMLAPKGSRLTIHGEDVKIDFGADEGLAIYFNGTDLADEVYENNDINDLLISLMKRSKISVGSTVFGMAQQKLHSIFTEALLLKWKRFYAHY